MSINLCHFYACIFDNFYPTAPFASDAVQKCLLINLYLAIRVSTRSLAVAISRHWETFLERGGTHFVELWESFLVLFCTSLTDAWVKSYGHFCGGLKKANVLCIHTGLTKLSLCLMRSTVGELFTAPLARSRLPSLVDKGAHLDSRHFCISTPKNSRRTRWCSFCVVLQELLDAFLWVSNGCTSAKLWTLYFDGLYDL